jgi:hypothetical protein
LRFLNQTTIKTLNPPSQLLGLLTAVDLPCDTLPRYFVIDSYRQLSEIERTFRMSKLTC